MYRSEDVREAIRTALRVGNDTAAWNSGMDRKQIVEEAEALFEDMVPVELLTADEQATIMYACQHSDAGRLTRPEEVELVSLVRKLIERIGDTEPCKGCGGQGWREGVEPDPRDETGMTPMQVQIQCECAGIGGDE